MIRRLAVIGSFELATMGFLSNAKKITVETRQGNVDAFQGTVGATQVTVMTRSGSRHPLPPHRINYAANIEALVQLGITDVIGTAMCATLSPAGVPVGSLVLLDQFIDFSKHREFTYYTDDGEFAFVDFTDPFCPSIGERILSCAAELGLGLRPHGCYVCVDGPRFETRAEVRMYGLLGGEVIGMTIAPECILAREAGLHYAAVAGIVNLAAGLQELGPGDAFLGSRSSMMQKVIPLLTRVAGFYEGVEETPQCTCHTAPYAYRESRRNR